MMNVTVRLVASRWSLRDFSPSVAQVEAEAFMLRAWVSEQKFIQDHKTRYALINFTCADEHADELAARLAALGVPVGRDITSKKATPG